MIVAAPALALVAVSALAEQTLGIAMPLDATAIKAGAADGGDRAGGGAVMSGANLDRAAQSQKLTVWRFILLDQIVSEFVNQRPIPGLMFSWGPRGTGVIAYTDADGRLTLLDQERRRQTIGGVKDAVLPAWSTGGERLAYAQKTR